MQHWIIQNNLYNEEGYEELVKTIEGNHISHQFVKVIPFTDDIDEEVNNPDDLPIMAMGSTTLARIAQNKGWYPGVFMNENSNWVAWRENWGKELLNHDSIVCAFNDVLNNMRHEEVFIRPLRDTKSFAGKVMCVAELRDWWLRVQAAEQSSWTSITTDEMVTIGPVKEIHQEYRIFVVDGMIITGSRYKVGKQVIYERIKNGDPVLEYAKERIKEWQPDRAFALDIALTPFGYKVIEVNCINSSGFYDADIALLVMRLQVMRFEK